jgi:hypothetical protein
LELPGQVPEWQKDGDLESKALCIHSATTNLCTAVCDSRRTSSHLFQFQSYSSRKYGEAEVLGLPNCNPRDRSGEQKMWGSIEPLTLTWMMAGITKKENKWVQRNVRVFKYHFNKNKRYQR